MESIDLSTSKMEEKQTPLNHNTNENEIRAYPNSIQINGIVNDEINSLQNDNLFQMTLVGSQHQNHNNDSSLQSQENIPHTNFYDNDQHGNIDYQKIIGSALIQSPTVINKSLYLHDCTNPTNESYPMNNFFENFDQNRNGSFVSQEGLLENQRLDLESNNCRIFQTNNLLGLDSSNKEELKSRSDKEYKAAMWFEQFRSSHVDNYSDLASALSVSQEILPPADGISDMSCHQNSFTDLYDPGPESLKQPVLDNGLDQLASCVKPSGIHPSRSSLKVKASQQPHHTATFDYHPSSFYDNLVESGGGATYANANSNIRFDQSAVRQPQKQCRDVNDYTTSHPSKHVATPHCTSHPRSNTSYELKSHLSINNHTSPTTSSTVSTSVPSTDAGSSISIETTNPSRESENTSALLQVGMDSRLLSPGSRSSNRNSSLATSAQYGNFYPSGPFLPSSSQLSGSCSSNPLSMETLSPMSSNGMYSGTSSFTGTSGLYDFTYPTSINGNSIYSNGFSLDYLNGTASDGRPTAPNSLISLASGSEANSCSTPKKTSSYRNRNSNGSGSKRKNSATQPVNTQNNRRADTGIYFDDGGSVSSSASNESSTTGLTATAYFWQYNAQCKGPKAVRLIPGDAADSPCSPSTYDPRIPPSHSCPVAANSLPGYPLVIFEDPVQRRQDLVHCSKLRRGDGNDVTPNLPRLRAMGDELERLSGQIARQGEIIMTGGGGASTGPPSATTLPTEGSLDQSWCVEEAKREKNKLASKICRLKKKAFHESNKIKYTGLGLEYNELATLLTQLKHLLMEQISSNGEGLRNGVTVGGRTVIPPKKNSRRGGKSASGKGSLDQPGDKNDQVNTAHGILYEQALHLKSSVHSTHVSGRTDSFVEEVLALSRNSHTRHPLVRRLASGGGNTVTATTPAATASFPSGNTRSNNYHQAQLRSSSSNSHSTNQSNGNKTNVTANNTIAQRDNHIANNPHIDTSFLNCVSGSMQQGNTENCFQTTENQISSILPLDYHQGDTVMNVNQTGNQSVLDLSKMAQFQLAMHASLEANHYEEYGQISGNEMISQSGFTHSHPSDGGGLSMNTSDLFYTQADMNNGGTVPGPTDAGMVGPPQNMYNGSQSTDFDVSLQHNSVPMYNLQERQVYNPGEINVGEFYQSGFSLSQMNTRNQMDIADQCSRETLEEMEKSVGSYPMPSSAPNISCGNGVVVSDSNTSQSIPIESLISSGNPSSDECPNIMDELTNSVYQEIPQSQNPSPSGVMKPDNSLPISVGHIVKSSSDALLSINL